MPNSKTTKTDPFQTGLGDVAFAFRGYNVTNRGRTAELLAHPAYGDTVRRYLRVASDVAGDVLNRPVDLAELIEQGADPALENYAEAIALIVGVELAQLQLLDEFHGMSVADARLAFGYSLGEISAVIASGVFELTEALRIPVSLANDCAELAHDVTMGIVFSRGPAIAEDDIRRLCLEVTAEGKGVVGISAVLSPNSYLILGQGKTVDRFRSVMKELLPTPASLRKNEHRWPPLHTPIVRQRYIPDRASVMFDTIPGGFLPPCPPILSLVTGKTSYHDFDAREILRQWIDRPQRLWDAVYGTLAAGIDTVVHIGPGPNLVPATFKRVSDNVKQQTTGRSIGKLGLRAVSELARRPWLSAMLPSKTSLLRCPSVRQIVLEDWLLDNPPQ